MRAMFPSARPTSIWMIISTTSSAGSASSDIHVIAVCQPAVPVLAASALLAAAGDPACPRSITLIGGPIDTREAPTEVNAFAGRHSLEWFRRNVIDSVPWGNAGFLRRVYPGFLQLAGFMAMNLDRHVEAHWRMVQHLVEGDGETLASTRAFYKEYKAVMDMPADYYLQTIATVFQNHLLPRGLLASRGRQGVLRGDNQNRAADDRRRAGRYIRHWPNARGTPTVQQFSSRQAAAYRTGGGWALRAGQWQPVPQRDCAPDQGVHAAALLR
jgi:hypothetical protein